MKKMLFVIALLSVQILSQGKILTKEKADELFGPVRYKVEISTEQLKMIVTKSSEVIMFKLMNNDLYILDKNRNTLLPEGVIISSSEVFSVYSVNIVLQLLSEGNEPFTTVEKRQDVLTITNGMLTLEYSVMCPPVCPN